MKFSSSEYSKLTTRLKRKYKTILGTILKNLKSARSSEIRDWVFENEEILQTYSPLNWFLLKQVRNYLDLLQTIPELSDDPETFTKKEDAVFERWNKSEFADVFLKHLNSGKSVKKASELTLIHVEIHLTILAKRHLEKIDAHHKSYRFQTSLGELEKKSRIIRLLETTLNVEGKTLMLKTRSMKEMKDFSSKIEKALKVIKEFSPSSWDRFVAFTQVIVPIDQEEFVSYSHQDLPGVSMINLYDRDFTDLLDDLLHENGHHHLNYYLNLEKLIEEPDDCIYYSPWRRTPRPLRGIYHAFFTFFWAFKLFSDLAGKYSSNERIYWRAIEEFWMLDFTFHDLQKAHRQGLINEKGWEIIQEQRKELTRSRRKILMWEKNLKSHKPALKKLKAELSKQR